MPDQSDAKIVYQRQNTIDDHQNVACYRRDLIFDVEYATVLTVAGTTITSVANTIKPKLFDQYSGVQTTEIATT
jgi:hypothetical protein